MNSAPGPADFHSHLVPGVDDGARDLDEALRAVDRFVEAGYRRLITTPHLDASLQHAPEALEERLAEVLSAFETLRTAAAERHPELELGQGFEVNLDVPDFSAADVRLRLAGTRFVLVEWPRMQIPPETTRLLGRLADTGVRPIVAHPERYHGIEQMRGITEEWRNAGAWLQVNGGSLAGRYGATARRIAIRLLRAGSVSWLASDFHGRDHLEVGYEGARAFFEEAEAMEAFHTLTVTNPNRLMDDEMPLPVQLLAESDGLFDRMKRWMGVD